MNCVKCGQDGEIVVQGEWWCGDCKTWWAYLDGLSRDEREAELAARTPPGRCPDCGRFCTQFYDVWTRDPYPQIDREVCRACSGV